MIKNILKKGLMLLWVLAAPLAFIGCDNGDPMIDITVKSDYGKIIEAINSANKSLTEKMSLIESAMSRGFADGKTGQALLGQAVEALSGTLAEKLSAVETAVMSQTSSLETKLGLIDAAVAGGFADGKAKQDLLQKAIQSLDGTAGTKLAAVEAAIGSQQTTLASKLDLIEEAVREGLADSQKKLELIVDALASLDGTLKEKLAAIDTAMTHQTDSLSLKLELIQGALATGIANDTTAVGLLRTAVASLQGSADEVAEALAAIDASLLPGGHIGQALDKLIEEVRTVDCSKILTAITRKLWLMAGKINGHDFVDLGNGLKWATCNVGAEHPWDKGDYFAWGETEPYYEGLNPLYWKENKNEGYYWSSYSDNPSGDSTHFIKYGYYDYGLKTLLEPEDDAAAAVAVIRSLLSKAVLGPLLLYLSPPKDLQRWDGLAIFVRLTRNHYGRFQICSYVSVG